MAQINKPNEYFNTVLYTGNGGTQSITGVNFQPDFTWIKKRSGATTGSNSLFDVIRGATKRLRTNATSAEETITNSLTSFDSDGFSVDNDVAINESSSTIVAWNWLASNTTASNTDGSIASTVSANTTSGFSIVSYTGTGSGATVGHGLGVAPKMVICKTRSTTGDWNSWHTGFSIQAKIALNTTEGIYNPGTGLYWNSTLPTSSVFSVGTSGNTNGSGITYISYCFTDVKGFSKFGSYTGNGSAGNGPFVYTGFKPAWVLIKWTGVEQWQIWDSKRDTYNVQQRVLAPNSNNAEDTNGSGGYLLIDSLSNGFKVRGNPVSNAINGSGQNYIYMAFAENPLVGTNNIPATAR